MIIFYGIRYLMRMTKMLRVVTRQKWSVFSIFHGHTYQQNLAIYNYVNVHTEAESIKIYIMISKISFNITKNPLKRNVLRIVRMILVDIIQCVLLLFWEFKVRACVSCSKKATQEKQSNSNNANTLCVHMEATLKYCT